MKVKVLWGFEGDPEKVKFQNGRVSAGQVLDLDDEEYGHQLIGKGLAIELDANGKPRLIKPKETKPSSSNEVKEAADKAAADKAAADKALADKAVADKAAEDKVLADKAAADKAAKEAK